MQRTAARWTCRRWRNTSSVGIMLDELEWPSLEARRSQSCLTFFYKIHSGTVSLDKDKYLTPAPNLQRTRVSHDLQYTRYFAYSDALKNSFFPRNIPLCNSLPSSVVSSKKGPYDYQKALYTGKHFNLPKSIKKTHAKGGVCMPCGLLFYVCWIIKMYTCGKKRYAILKRD